MLRLTAGRPRRRFGPLLAVVLALWIPLAATIGYGALAARRDARRAEEHRLRDAVRTIVVAVDARLGTYIAGLATLARSPLLAGPLDAEAFERQARAAGAVLGGVVVLNTAPPTNTILATTSPDPARQREAIASGMLREAVAPLIERVHATGKPALSDLFIAPVLERPLVAIGVPVPAPWREPRRLTLTLEPEALSALLREIGLPPWSEASIRDGRFRLVASTDAARRAGEADGLDWVVPRMAGRQEAVLTGSAGDGPATVVAAARLATDPRWMVTVAEPLSRHEASAVAALRWPLAGLGLALLAIGVVAWAARRDSIARGEEDAAILHRAQDQVDRLHAGLPAILLLREFTPEGEPGRLIYVAGDITHVTGLPADALQTTNIGDLTDAPEAMRRFRATLVRTGEATIDWRMRQPDGAWRWLRCKGRLLDTLPNGHALVVSYIVDITVEREAEAQVQAASRIASLAEMAHGLAHELKQPLQIIALKAEIAQAMADQVAEMAGPAGTVRETAGRIREALEGIVDQAIRSGELVEHLRRFARGSAEGTPTEPVALEAAVEGALVLAAHGVTQAGIDLRIALPEGLPPVMAQRIGVEQILINLLNNARDALADRPREAPRWIRIAATPAPDGATVALTVSDNGGGIPATVLDRLFQPFVTTKGTDKGTGLGLAICHGLARGMGATLGAENGPEGAVFTLRLAVARDPGPAAVPADADCPAGPGTASDGA